MVDNFSVKYAGKEHADHLIMALKKNYDISTDEEGTKYCGLTLDWDFENRQVHLSMPGCVEKALQRFKYDHPKKPQDQPHQHVLPTYGAKVQYAQAEDQLRPLDNEENKFVQQVCGTFSYYGRAVDIIMLVALSSIASQ